MNSIVGVPQVRLDARDKVTGATRYAGDIAVPDLLHARLVLSLEAHAEIKQVNTAEASGLPDVVRVLTAADLPVVATGDSRFKEPLAHHEIVFAGQPLALVVARTEVAAEAGAQLVGVDYDVLPPVLDLESAMAPDSPLARLSTRKTELGETEASLHASFGGGGEALAEELSENVVSSSYREVGDVGRGFAESDAVVFGRFETNWVYQAYLEPQVATAWVEPGGSLVVSSSTQAAFRLRDALAALFGLSQAEVRVVPAPVGGAFGGKLLVIEPLVAAATLLLRSPVRLCLTRMEDFAATNPAPGELIDLRIGGRKQGTLTALEARVVCDRGSNREFGVEEISGSLVSGPYDWPSFAVSTYGVLTNRFGAGAYRAPGATPAAFALESLMDELATELRIDPLELRLRNLPAENDDAERRVSVPVAGCKECIRRLQEHSLWKRRAAVGADEGIGVALGFWPGATEPAAAMVRLDSDGCLTVITAAVDLTGSTTAFAAIAAETFGLSPDRVRVVAADTSSGPYAGASSGSKTTYTVGRAVEKAAAAAREQLLRIASDELEIGAPDLEIVDGIVQPRGTSNLGLSVEDVAKRARSLGARHEPIEAHARASQPHLSPSAAAHVVHVRVDRETGEVELLGYVVAQDVGRAINPALVEGQMRGGVTQGIGWALYEQLQTDESGQLLSGSFLEYGIPLAEHLPEIETLIVEAPTPDGPFGAKGMAEASVIAGAAAIANAIAAATGTRMRRLPMSPPLLWLALEGDN